MSELLTVDEVARECRVHPITVRRQISSGRLRAVRVGRRLRIRREDVEAFLVHEAIRSESVGHKTGILKPGDPMLTSVGIFEDSATDVSPNKHKYLSRISTPSLPASD